MTTILTRGPVTVEKTASGRFVAQADVTLQAEGDTAEQAVANLRADPPARLEPIRMSDQPNAWVPMVGWLPDDELTAAWRQAMADRRAELAAQELAEDSEEAP